MKNRPRLTTIVSYGILIPLPVVVPVLLWKLNLPIISSTSGPEYRVFEIFAFCVSLTVVIIALLRIRKAETNDLTANFPIILFTLLVCYFATQITEFRPQSADWLSYEHAAQAVINGTNPYQETGYLYPPLTALVLASVYQIVVWVGELPHLSTNPELAWQGVFYLYQCCQFFLLVGAIALCIRLARTLGASDVHSVVLVALLFVFNTPLLRTLYFHQVNLWLLDLILFALFYVNTSPLLSGLALIVATHVKLYAAIVLLPFTLMKQFRAVAWALMGGVCIVAIQTEWGTNLTLWQQYITASADFPSGTTFRDNSLHSILHNTFAFANWTFLHLHTGTFSSVFQILWLLATGSVVLWFGWRYFKRERSFVSMDSSDAEWGATCRMYGHVFDAIAMALIISPLVWEHHYVLTIPIIIWVALTRGKQKPWQVGAGAFLICAIPIFDVYPFSYHRIAGLLLLLSASPPEIAERRVEN